MARYSKRERAEFEARRDIPDMYPRHDGMAAPVGGRKHDLSSRFTRVSSGEWHDACPVNRCSGYEFELARSKRDRRKLNHTKTGWSAK